MAANLTIGPAGSKRSRRVVQGTATHPEEGQCGGDHDHDHHGLRRKASRSVEEEGRDRKDGSCDQQ